eukprot:scaffold1687_cov405-Prasinococcus_capsulatus_cf.AAC.21
MEISTSSESKWTFSLGSAACSLRRGEGKGSVSCAGCSSLASADPSLPAVTGAVPCTSTWDKSESENPDATSSPSLLEAELVRSSVC